MRVCEEMKERWWEWVLWGAVAVSFAPVFIFSFCLRGREGGLVHSAHSFSSAVVWVCGEDSQAGGLLVVASVLVWLFARLLGWGQGEVQLRWHCRFGCGVLFVGGRGCMLCLGACQLLLVACMVCGELYRCGAVWCVVSDVHFKNVDRWGCSVRGGLQGIGGCAIELRLEVIHVCGSQFRGIFGQGRMTASVLLSS